MKTNNGKRRTILINNYQLKSVHNVHNVHMVHMVHWVHLSTMSTEKITINDELDFVALRAGVGKVASQPTDHDLYSPCSFAKWPLEGIGRDRRRIWTIWTVWTLWTEGRRVAL